MADKDQTVGSLGIIQRWKEFVSGYHARLFGAMLYTPNGDSMADDTADAVKTVGVAGTAVLGKVRLVTATGDEITDDTADAVKAKLAANSGVDIGDVDVTSIKLGNQDGGIADGATAIVNPISNIGEASGGLVVTNRIYNGSSFDFLRGIASSGEGKGVVKVGTLGELITLAASAARTESANGTAVTGLGWRNRYIVLFDLTVADTDAGDTLDVYVDVSLDGTTWLNAVHFTQIIGTDAASKRYAVLDPSAPGTAEILVTADAAAGVVRPSMFGAQMRARWAIVDAGTDDASFTFSIVAFAI